MHKRLAIQCDIGYVICIGIKCVLQDQAGGDRAGKGLDEWCTGEMNDSIKETVQSLFRRGDSCLAVHGHTL